MPYYSKRSWKNLLTVHKDLQEVFAVVIQHFDNTIVWGYRGREAQNLAFMEGKSTKAWPDSTHNREPSDAVDAYPYPIDYDDIQRWHYFAGFVMGVAAALYELGKIKSRLRWGGDWDRDTELKDEKFRDLGHFERRDA